MGFEPSDLSRLDRYILSQAEAVVSLREVFAGNRASKVIGMRHDIDNAPGAFSCGLRIARWEAKRGYRSTYYLLHTAAYWRAPSFEDGVREFAALGHEVGIHNDALGRAVEVGGDPNAIFAEALETLRAVGPPIRSVVAHGNRLLLPLDCRNDEIFKECARPNFGDPNRMIGELRLDPLPLAEYELDFEAARTLGRALELADSGGNGWIDLHDIEKKWPRKGQLHINQHPDWWTRAI